MERIFYNIDIVNWIYGTVEKVKTQKIAWNKAWYDTYFELDGKSEASAQKGCPRAAVRILYEKGYLLKHKPDTPFDETKPTPQNGVYAEMAVKYLCEKSECKRSILIKEVHKMAIKELGTAPKSDQGAVRITHILWEADEIHVP